MHYLRFGIENYNFLIGSYRCDYNNKDIEKSVDHKSGVYIIIIWGLQQHISVQRDHLQAIHISKITKMMPWVYI
jgi:hypothetical protein